MNRQIWNITIGTERASPPYPAILSRTNRGASGSVTISLQPFRPQPWLFLVTCSYGPDRKFRTVL